MRSYPVPCLARAQLWTRLPGALLRPEATLWDAVRLRLQPGLPAGRTLAQVRGGTYSPTIFLPWDRA